MQSPKSRKTNVFEFPPGFPYFREFTAIIHHRPCGGHFARQIIFRSASSIMFSFHFDICFFACLSLRQLSLDQPNELSSVRHLTFLIRFILREYN